MAGSSVGQPPQARPYREKGKLLPQNAICIHLATARMVHLVLTRAVVLLGSPHVEVRSAMYHLHCHGRLSHQAVTLAHQERGLVLHLWRMVKTARAQPFQREGSERQAASHLTSAYEDEGTDLTEAAAAAHADPARLAHFTLVKKSPHQSESGHHRSRRSPSTLAVPGRSHPSLSPRIRRRAGA